MIKIVLLFGFVSAVVVFYLQATTKDSAGPSTNKYIQFFRHLLGDEAGKLVRPEKIKVCSYCMHF